MKTIWIILIVLLTTTCNALDADPPVPTAPPLPIDKISAELGIKPEDFSECYSYLLPSAKSLNASEAQQLANNESLLSCLQITNTALTEDQVKAILSKYMAGTSTTTAPAKQLN
jgi:hypothetical protein